jgi:hypothetical protein
VAQKPIPHVPKFTLKTLSQENEGTLAQNHLILSHDPVSDTPTYRHPNAQVIGKSTSFELAA